MITHSELVKALVKPAKQIVMHMSEFDADLWHGATGVAGEAGELLEAVVGVPDDNTRNLVVEELGDLEFYMEQVRQRTGLSRDDSIDNNEDSYDEDLALDFAALVAIQACAVLDTVKKTVIYNKPLDLALLARNLRDLDSAMLSVRQHYNVSRDEVLAYNVDKLMKRYASLTYSDSAAQLRADKANETPARRFMGMDCSSGTCSVEQG